MLIIQHEFLFLQNRHDSLQDSIFVVVKATLIISVYKDVEALHAIFRSLKKQVEKDFDVIVSQDADDPCFDELIQAYTNDFAITHIQQEDIGFRKNRMLNKAIKISKTNILIFIDGDCVLHPRFIQQHALLLHEGRFCVGRRVDLDAKTSQAIKNGTCVLPSIKMLFKNKATRIEEGFFLPGFLRKHKPKLLGCNMSWHKNDLIKLNGFDETYETPGFGEDTDIEFRAKKAGIKPYSTRFRTIQYHLFHERPTREDQVKISKELYYERIKRVSYQCQKGLEYLPE